MMGRADRRALLAACLLAGVAHAAAIRSLQSGKPHLSGYKKSQYGAGDKPDSHKCEQGTIPWDTDKNPSWYAAKHLGCKPMDGHTPLKYHKGDKVDNIDCDSNPLACPETFDGTLEGCQAIAMLGVADQVSFSFGTANWITYNAENGGCYIYDSDTKCHELSDEDSDDYSFQFCGEGYLPSEYEDGDKPHGSCHGDLDASMQMWWLAKGLGCKPKHDDDEPFKLHKGDKVKGCHDDYCTKEFDGTLDACQRIAVEGLVGDNDDVPFGRGSWVTYNAESESCYIWFDCYKLSDDSSGDSSFQYCGMT